MSSYNYNVQISVANSNAVAREQEKAKNVSKKHQDQTEAIMKKSAKAQGKVSAVPSDEVSYQVHNEKERSHASMVKKVKKKQKEDVSTDDILVDDNKGNKVNVVC